jgi:hypothetical protein
MHHVGSGLFAGALLAGNEKNEIYLKGLGQDIGYLCQTITGLIKYWLLGHVQFSNSVGQIFSLWNE